MTRLREISQTHKDERRAWWKLGVYILWVAVLSTLLCAVNTGLIFALTRGVETHFADMLGVQQIQKFLLAIGPVLLIFAQWYAWDVLTGKRTRG